MLTCTHNNQLSIGDHEFERTLIHTYKNNMEEDLLKLREAYINQSIQLVHHYLHDIKGASSYVGAEIVCLMVSRMAILSMDTSSETDNGEYNGLCKSYEHMDKLENEIKEAIALMDKYIISHGGEGIPRE